MSRPASKVARRYASSDDYQILRLEWSNFSGWHFETLEKDLEVLDKAVDSAALRKLLKVVSDLKTKYQSLVTEYSPQLRSLIPATLPKVRASLLKDLRFWVHLDRVSFTDESVYGAVDKSQLAKVLGQFPRDRVIDRIMSLPEDVTPEDLEWLKQIDLSPFKKALANLHKYLPDFSPGPQDLGSYAYFERWRAGLPDDFASWEDALPNDFSELGALVEETTLGKRLSKALGDKSLFDYIQDSAVSLVDTLDALKA